MNAAYQLVAGFARQKYAVWFETFGRIVAKTGDLLGGPERPLKQNYLQRQLNDVWEFFESHKLPVRIIILKPRQKGSSTDSVARLYHKMLTSVRALRTRIMGGRYDQVENLWGILSVYAKNDKCAWPNGGLEVMADRAYVRRSEADTECKWETANNPDAGRSATIQGVIVTELGRWQNDGVANAAKVLSGLLNCVPKEPGTFVIMESTAQGAQGEFHSRYWAAPTLEERRAGVIGSGYIRVFAPWYEFEDSCMALSEADRTRLLDDLDETEKRLMRDYPGKITLNHIAWRRATIADDFDGDSELFKQEFPTTEDEAFLMSGRPRISPEGIARQRDAAATAVSHREAGYLDETGPHMANMPTVGQTGLPPLPAAGDGLGHDIGFVWRQVDDSPNEPFIFHRYEAPRDGCFYSLSVDVMRGASQVAGDDPDCHSVVVLRRGYFDDHSGRWVPPAVAARIRPPVAGLGSRYKYACRWDADFLARQIWRLARYYGPSNATCQIVVEMNVDIGLLTLLQQMPGVVNLYQREVFNEREQRLEKKLGWLTTVQTRPRVIDALAAAVRDPEAPGGGVLLNCPHAIDECEHLIWTDSGKIEAAPGWHDDDAMSIGIGLVTLAGATRYTLATHGRGVPAEVRRYEERRQAGGAGEQVGQFG